MLLASFRCFFHASLPAMCGFGRASMSFLQSPLCVPEFLDCVRQVPWSCLVSACLYACDVFLAVLCSSHFFCICTCFVCVPGTMLWHCVSTCVFCTDLILSVRLQSCLLPVRFQLQCAFLRDVACYACHESAFASSFWLCDHCAVEGPSMAHNRESVLIQ